MEEENGKNLAKTTGTEKLLRLDCKVSVLQHEAFWRHRGCRGYCWCPQKSQVPVNVKLHVNPAV